MDTSLHFPEWLDHRIGRTVQNTPFNTRPFLKLNLMSLSEIKTDYIISSKLRETLIGFPLILTLTCPQNVYDQTKMFKYDEYSDFQRIPEWNISSRLIYKMKAISFIGIFDAVLEQELGLAMGIICGVSQMQGYQLSNIPENLYSGLTDRSMIYPARKFVHMIGIRESRINLKQCTG
jgi:hypothetical protein